MIGKIARFSVGVPGASYLDAGRRSRLRPALLALWAATALGLAAPTTAQQPRVAAAPPTRLAAPAPAPADLAAPAPADRGGALAPIVQAVAGAAMTVSDMDRSLAFYQEVLSFEKVSDIEVWGDAYEELEGVFGLRMRVVQLRLGDETLQLTEYLAPRGRPIPADSRSNDRWFQHVAIIVSDMDRAYRWLRDHQVHHASTGPQRLPDWNPNAGGIEAFYFKDPDGHVLEVLHFPPGKGDSKWQRPTDRLFLGIDHTAIVVGDTEASLAFYRDRLGLTVAGESENYGTEQEHLNNVFGARLRITALRAGSGPGIEFLEYLSPRDGRPIPPDLRANDVTHWETLLSTPDGPEAASRLLGGATAYVSPGLVELPDDRLGFTRGFAVYDPDGHVVQLEERRKHGSAR